MQRQPRRLPKRNRCVRLGHRLRRRRHAPFGTWRSGNDSCDRRDHESRNERCRKGNYLGASVPPWMTANVRVLPPHAQRSELKESVNSALLGGFRRMQERTPHCLRRLNLDKAARCVQVILSALVYNADIAVSGGRLIGHDAVDLVQLKRRRITTVVYAHSERIARLALFHSYSSRYLFRLNSFFPIPCAS